MDLLQPVAAAAPRRRCSTRARSIRKARFPRETIPASVVTRAARDVRRACSRSLAVVTLAIRGTLDVGAARCCRSCSRACARSCSGSRSPSASCTRTSATSRRSSAAALLPWFFLSPIFFGVDADHAERRAPRASCSSGSTRSRRSSSPCATCSTAASVPRRDGARSTSLVARGRSRCVGGRALFRRHGGRAGGGRVSRAGRDRARARVARVRGARRPGPHAQGAAARAAARGGPAAGAGAARRVAARRAGRDRRRSSGATARARRRRCACSRGSCRCDSRARATCGGRVVALLELGAGFGRDFTGRENIFLNGALHGLTRERDRGAPGRRSSPSPSSASSSTLPVATYSQGMFLRLGLRDRRAPRRRRAAHRRGARGRRRGVPAQVRGADRRADRGGRDARARLARRRRWSSARASGSSCSTTGGVVFDGPTAEGLRLLPAREALVASREARGGARRGARAAARARGRAARTPTTCAGFDDRADRPRLDRAAARVGGHRARPRPRALDAPAGARRSPWAKRALVRVLRQYLARAASRSRRASTSTLAVDAELDGAGRAARSGGAARVIVHQVLSGAGPVDAVTTQALALPRALHAPGAGAGATSRSHIDPRDRTARSRRSRALDAGAGDVLLIHYSAYAPKLRARARPAEPRAAALAQRHAGALVLGPRADDRGPVRARPPAAAASSPRAADVVAGVSRVQRGASSARDDRHPDPLRPGAARRAAPTPSRDGPPTILFVGRLAPHKRQDEVIRAVRALPPPPRARRAARARRRAAQRRATLRRLRDARRRSSRRAR